MQHIQCPSVIFLLPIPQPTHLPRYHPLNGRYAPQQSKQPVLQVDDSQRTHSTNDGHDPFRQANDFDSTLIPCLSVDL